MHLSALVPTAEEVFTTEFGFAVISAHQLHVLNAQGLPSRRYLLMPFRC